MTLFLVQRISPNFSMGGRRVTATWHVWAVSAEDIWALLPRHENSPWDLFWNVEPFPTLDLGEFKNLEHDWASPGCGKCNRCGYNATLRPDNAGPCIPTKEVA